MDKGKAIKLGIAAVILAIAAFLIFRAMSGEGDTIDTTETTPTLGAAPAAILLPIA